MPQDDDLLLRETNHRCSNDLQLVVSLLALQSCRATSPETRAALNDAMERVSLRQYDAHQIIVTVDDNGLPFPEITDRRGTGIGLGLGLGLVKRLIASTGGLIILPTDSSKIFELRVPV
jgi:two-component sensor histidine kinase